MEVVPEEVRITGTNGRVREVRAVGPAAPLAKAEGLLVTLEGTWRRGAIDVDTWRIEEGPHGMPAYVGRAQWQGDDLVLRRLDESETIVLWGEISDVLEEETGRLVLVEGVVVGPYEIEVTDVRFLE